jgi:hypothetical protein
MYEDWYNSPYHTVPASCCKQEGCKTEDLNAIYTEVCDVIIRDTHLKGHLWSSSSVAEDSSRLGCYAVSTGKYLPY